MPVLDDPPVFVAITDEPVVLGRSGKVSCRLPHPTVSRRHATLRRSPGGLAVEDHQSRFGTFVNGVRIGSTRLQTGDRIRFGAVLTYRVQAGGLSLEIAAQGLSLQASGLAVDVPAATGSAPSRALVHEISFRIEPDTFVGILGPSGAGKSTILNLLATLQSPSRGRVRFDGDQDVAGDSRAIGR